MENSCYKPFISCLLLTIKLSHSTRKFIVKFFFSEREKSFHFVLCVTVTQRKEFLLTINQTALQSLLETKQNITYKTYGSHMNELISMRVFRRKLFNEKCKNEEINDRRVDRYIDIS